MVYYVPPPARVKKPDPRRSGCVEGDASSTRAVSLIDEAVAVADVAPPFSGGAPPISVKTSPAASALSSGVDPLSLDIF